VLCRTLARSPTNICEARSTAAFTRSPSEKVVDRNPDCGDESAVILMIPPKLSRKEREKKKE